MPILKAQFHLSDRKKILILLGSAISNNIRDFFLLLKRNWVFLLFALAVSTAYLIGVARVPFHPDESTQIYMSGDLELFFQDPTALFWRADPAQPLRQHYRLLDAPLARDLIGLGRQVAGLSATPADWDWSKSWEQNRQAGALPDEHLLWVSRFSLALLFPLSLALFFAAAHTLGGPPLAWLASLLFAGNALVLLHTRRAMAEGPLLFTICLMLFALVRLRKHLWLLAVPAALAFNAKQSAAGLFLVGLVAIFWTAKRSLRQRMLDALLCGLAFALVTLLLNPFLWSDPLRAGQAALTARASLAGAQVGFFGAVEPVLVLGTGLQRLVGLISQLFIAPPAFADVGNYLQQTHASEVAYLANPLNDLLRGFMGGAVLMLLAVYGSILAALDLRRFEPKLRRNLGLLLIAGLVQLLVLLALIPIPFQRYYLPLIPFACLWSAYAVLNLIKMFALALRRARA